MKKIVFVLLFFFTLSTVFTSCREKKENDVEEVIEDAGDAVEDAADEIEDEVE